MTIVIASLTFTIIPPGRHVGPDSANVNDANSEGTFIRHKTELEGHVERVSEFQVVSRHPLVLIQVRGSQDEG